MKYDISKATAPAMPNLGKGTECIKFLLTQASKDMHEPLVPMLFPSLGAHISGAEFQYPDRSWKETCGMMAQLVGNSGDNKGQLTDLVKAICRDFTRHDEAEYKKLEEWSNLYQAKKNAKDTPVCPTMGDLVEWLVYHDLWSKMHLFADMFSQATDQVSEAQRRGPKNMLDNLPDTFNEAQLEALRVEIGKSKDGTKGQLSLWVHRKFIIFSSETGLYTKTDEYLKKSDV